jgi:hypothetical protein
VTDPPTLVDYRPRPREQALLEQRAGPKARKILERFLARIDKLERSEEEAGGLETDVKVILKPRGEICQPLRRGIDQRRLDCLVEPGQDQHADGNEYHSERHLDGVTCRKQLVAPAY